MALKCRSLCYRTIHDNGRRGATAAVRARAASCPTYEAVATIAGRSADCYRGAGVIPARAWTDRTKTTATDGHREIVLSSEGNCC